MLFPYNFKKSFHFSGYVPLSVSKVVYCVCVYFVIKLVRCLSTVFLVFGWVRYINPDLIFISMSQKRFTYQEIAAESHSFPCPRPHTY